jgi:hypothetical protein
MLRIKCRSNVETEVKPMTMQQPRYSKEEFAIAAMRFMKRKCVPKLRRAIRTESLHSAQTVAIESKIEPLVSVGQ